MTYIEAVLIQLELFTISEIAKKTSVNYASAKKHLEILENDNILVSARANGEGHLKRKRSKT